MTSYEERSLPELQHHGVGLGKVKRRANLAARTCKSRVEMLSPACLQLARSQFQCNQGKFNSEIKPLF